MELHSCVKAKQLWSFLRVAIFMMRKGLLSKRKLISMEMNLMMKRGMLLGKNLGNIMALHHHSKTKQSPPISPILYGFQEYQFSSENSPNPNSFHMNPKRRRSYFPCISASTSATDDDEPDKNLESSVVSTQCHNSPGILPADVRRQMLNSPFSVRVSDYSMEEGVNGGLSEEVDNQAEEFIRRFYEQLQAQSPGTNLHPCRRIKRNNL